MKKISNDVTIIGGGPAGLISGISAKKSGADKVMIIDRNNWIGGILPQCIHDGFGIRENDVSLTGPEYINEYIMIAKKIGIDLLKETIVLSFNKKLELITASKKGLIKINSKSIILAMGCREKTRGNLLIPGDRPSGIYTAGLSQTLINLYNLMPGKNIYILGSGDIGLIMARRLKLEGANVKAVIELLPYPSGLPRNIVQCLNDFEIPLLLNHTITNIVGRDRLEKITISKVDKKKNPIKGTEKIVDCDTLLLSVGLIPENELSKEAGVIIDNCTGGPIVDENFETSLPGVFACGNCLQVYDNVDLLSTHSKIAGEKSANKYIKIKNSGLKNNKNIISVKSGNGIKQIIPQKIRKPGIIDFSFRLEEPKISTNILFKLNDNLILTKKLKYPNISSILEIKLEIPSFSSNSILEVSLNDKL